MDGVPIEAMEVTAIEVLGEQPNGETEREFKRSISGIFRQHPTVAEAYLMRVRYSGQGDESVALGLRFVGPDVDEQVITETGLAFRTMFGGGGQHLDIIPLDEDSVEQLEFKPFYVVRFETTG
jgi:hypothetical protein